MFLIVPYKVALFLRGRQQSSKSLVRTAESAASMCYYFVVGVLGVMEKYVDLLISALAFVGRPIVEAGRYLFAELGPFAWIVCALVPVIAILGFSSLIKSRTR